MYNLFSDFYTQSVNTCIKFTALIFHKEIINDRDNSIKEVHCLTTLFTNVHICYVGFIFV